MWSESVNLRRPVGKTDICWLGQLDLLNREVSKSCANERFSDSSRTCRSMAHLAGTVALLNDKAMFNSMNEGNMKETKGEGRQLRERGSMQSLAKLLREI